MEIMALEGVSSVGVNSDNLAATFDLTVSVLATVYSGRVLLRNQIRHTDAAALVQRGMIVVDKTNYKVHGFFMGEDPLHVYERLV